MGGSSSDGIMTGVDRAPFQFGTKPIDFPGTQEEYDKQMQELQSKGIIDESGKRTGGKGEVKKLDIGKDDLPSNESRNAILFSNSVLTSSSPAFKSSILN